MPSCLFKSPHPEIVFKVKGLEVILHDPGTRKKLQSIKKLIMKLSAIGFRSQKDTLENKNQMKGTIAQRLDDLSSSNSNSYNYVAIVAVVMATTLAAIRLGEYTW